MKVNEIYDPDESASIRRMVGKSHDMFANIEQTAKLGINTHDPEQMHKMFQRILNILGGKSR